MAAGAEKDAAVAAAVSFVHEAPAHTSSKSTVEESYKGHKSRRICHRTPNRTRRNLNNKSSKSDPTVPMNNTDSSRKAGPDRHAGHLSLAESDFDHSIPRACYKNNKKYQALAVTCPVTKRYKDELYSACTAWRIFRVGKTSKYTGMCQSGPEASKFR